MYEVYDFMKRWFYEIWTALEILGHMVFMWFQTVLALEADVLAEEIDTHTNLTCPRSSAQL